MDKLEQIGHSQTEVFTKILNILNETVANLDAIDEEFNLVAE